MGRRHRPNRFGLMAALLLAVGLAPGGAQAAETRIGYIDSARIFQEYRVAQEAQASFDRQVQGWRSEAAEKQKLVDQLRADVRDQGPILSALRRQQKEEALQRAISDYEKFVQDTWGPNGRASQENERATQDVISQIRSAVEKVAGDHQMDLVLDAAGGFIIYADKTLDLTSAVLQELADRTSSGTSH